MVRQQRTLKSEVVYEGVGIHTGEKTTLKFIPAEPNTGLRFRVRHDGDWVEIPAHVDSAPQDAPFERSLELCQYQIASGRVQLKKELADDLQRAIADGTYGIGDLLPTEQELGADYGVSRHTVRAALRCLYDLGLVTRRQGSGTQVVARQPGSAYRQSLGSLDDILQYAAKTRLTLQPGQTVAARGELARLLDCAPGREWRYYAGIRRAPRGRTPGTTTRCRAACPGG